jgi:hypothetical protein
MCRAGGLWLRLRSHDVEASRLTKRPAGHSHLTWLPHVGRSFSAARLSQMPPSLCNQIARTLTPARLPCNEETPPGRDTLVRAPHERRSSFTGGRREPWRSSP